MMKNFLFVIIIPLTILSCTNSEKDELNGQVYSNVLDPLLDSLLEVNDLLNSRIFLYNFYPDELMNKVLVSQIDSFSENESLLLQKLSIAALDSVDRMEIHNFTGTSEKIWTEQSKIDSVRKNGSNDFFRGFFNLSNVVFNENQKKGCFYLNLHCGDNCGGYYVIFIDLKSEKWEIYKTVTLG